MKCCNDKDCAFEACCNHCKHMLITMNLEYKCGCTNSEVHPLDLCDGFECFRLYDEEVKGQ